MTPAKLPHHRLHSQRIAATSVEDPAGPVRWLGAVQAQDYLGSLWAMVNGRVVGSWTRALGKETVTFDLRPFTARRYAAFLELSADAS